MTVYGGSLIPVAGCQEIKRGSDERRVSLREARPRAHKNGPLAAAPLAGSVDQGTASCDSRVAKTQVAVLLGSSFSTLTRRSSCLHGRGSSTARIFSQGEVGCCGGGDIGHLPFIGEYSENGSATPQAREIPLGPLRTPLPAGPGSWLCRLSASRL